MVEDRPQRITLEDYSNTSTPQYFTSMVRPEVQAANITYPHSLIQLIQGNLFHGLPNEDPYAHLATYIEICNTMKIAGVPEDAICLNLFPFSLAGEAKRCDPVQLNTFIDGLRPHSKQLLDAFAGGKIILKTLDEVMELIENMATSDHAILRDRAYTPTKKSLLELTSQDRLLAQNKLLAKQI
ncbi:uncharacterized protein LOC114391489 [Glycine soja]|uniref:uncharacterized protein n=1 Tax=Glycine max TaxID=3847 RepID=UPI0003DE8AA6|nr:uncharacterized protein LOC112999919 [Glycine max]XP_028208297.1 uncharacterized protein LOC114391489 [Glycine soja]|eukprot:XP_025982123.1 uncharacterized protein LOC112999919 [Glycine max]